LLRQIETFELERESLLTEMVNAQERAETARVLSQITERDVERLLAALMERMDELEPTALKDFLRGLVQHVELDPITLTCRIQYQIRLGSGVKLASPRGGASPT
jgi:hypothetical protein